MREFNKIFIISLPRCATVSVSAALGQLGIRIAHLGRIDGDLETTHHDSARLIRLHEQVTAGDFQFDLLSQCDGLADYPSCISEVYHALDSYYPESLFINVRRDFDKQAWLRSAERQFIGLKLIKEAPDSPPQEQAFMRAMTDFRRMTFGQSEFQPEAFLRAYERHQRDVAAHFSGRETSLLNIADVTILHERGFELLCNFLQCDVKTSPFPSRNEHSRAPEEAFLNALERGDYISSINEPTFRSTSSESDSQPITE